MTKLPKEYQFLDLSDYGRSIAIWIARSILDTRITPIHVTISFIISGITAIYCIINGWFLAAAFFLILKSILDAADGTLARMRNKPSYVGRYFDSVSDIILNFFILLTIWSLTEVSIMYMLLAFISMQLQGTLYNYYYVIFRKRREGDTTSRIFETKPPKALPGESQKRVNLFFNLYFLTYGIFDKIIFSIDKNAIYCNYFPKLFLTVLSIFGLGFQLLIISVFLVLDLPEAILPFFIFLNILIVIIVFLRKWLNRRVK